MGTSTSAAQLAGKIDRLARDLNNPSVPLAQTALAGKRIFESAAASAGVLGSVMEGKRRPVGARFDMAKASRRAGTAVAVITYTGPAHLTNNPTSRHVIVARRLGMSRRSARGRRTQARLGASVAFGGGAQGLFGSLLAATRTTRSGAVRSQGAQALTIGSNLRPYAFHPGTAGKGYFAKAKAVAERKLPDEYGRAQLTAPLRKTFG